MGLPDSFQRLLTAPAPGLVFSAQPDRGLAERAYPAPHTVGPPASWLAQRRLRRLCGDESLRDALSDLYGRFDGMVLFSLRDMIEEFDSGAVDLLSVGWWQRATAAYSKEEALRRRIQSSSLYASGTWRVIGYVYPDQAALTMFFDGTHQGRSLAGRVFLLTVDGNAGQEQELAPSLDALLESIGADPVGFLSRVGFRWSLPAEDGAWCEGRVMGYVEDVRTHPARVDWQH